MNWTYWADGQRGGLNQVFLTPGLVIGRFEAGSKAYSVHRPASAIQVRGGAGTIRPTPLTPAYNNGWVFTTRFNF